MLLRTLSTRHWRKMIPKRWVTKELSPQIAPAYCLEKVSRSWCRGRKPRSRLLFSLRRGDDAGSSRMTRKQEFTGSIGREDRAAHRESRRTAMFLLEDSLNSWSGQGGEKLLKARLRISKMITEDSVWISHQPSIVLVPYNWSRKLFNLGNTKELWRIIPQ